LTPVCGFTPLAIGGTVSLSYHGPSVIRNLAEWQGLFASTGMIIFAGTPTPTPPPPPVNFANLMLILSFTTVCPTSAVSITGVCEGPNQITISATNTPLCVFCNVGTTFYLWSAIAVPQSSLPVVWNTTTVQPICFPTSTPSPTATP
jgi:hypothetical protein